MQRVTLSQRDVLGEGGVWPMRVRLVLVDAAGAAEQIPMTLESISTELPRLNGRPVPRFAYANDGDYGYGLFLLDAASRAYLLREIGSVGDALWESVRAAEQAPSDYLVALIRELATERDEVTINTLLSRLQIVFRWYLSDTQQAAAAPNVEQCLEQMMAGAPAVGVRILAFRAYAAVAWSEEGRARLKRLLATQHAIAGVTLSSNDRFRIIRRLLVLGDADAQALLVRQADADASDEGRRGAYASRSAIADAQSKRDLLGAFLTDARLPERWIEDSLAPFNAVEHEQITVALLEQALRALPELKRTRKIFFVNDWLGAFVGGQRSVLALQIVQRVLNQDGLPDDLRRKLAEVADDLERTVRIRARYAMAR